MVRIYDVQSVAIAILKSNPPQIIVSAVGRASSTGWSNPTLGAWYYIDVPKDGIQDFDFTADEPTGISLPVLCPIAASTLISRDPANYWGKGRPLVGVRIHARTNLIEERLEGKSETFELMSGEDGWPMPWPFPTSRWKTLSGPSAGGGGFNTTGNSPVGCSLRVYHTGDALTKDYRLDRYNVELSPSTERIVQVWYG